MKPVSSQNYSDLGHIFVKAFNPVLVSVKIARSHREKMREQDPGADHFHVSAPGSDLYSVADWVDSALSYFPDDSAACLKIFSYASASSSPVIWFMLDLLLTYESITFMSTVSSR